MELHDDQTSVAPVSPRSKPTRRTAIAAVASAAILGVTAFNPSRAFAATTPSDLRDLERSMPDGSGSATARASAVTSQWGGYANGAIPVTAMTRVPAEVGDPYLRPDAAAAYFALSEAYRKEFGSALAIREAYRGLARQQSLWNDYQNGTGNLAAYPGTSVHGWALAIDFTGGVQTPGSAQKRWMNANGPAFGWQPRGDSFSQPEAWHFEYDGSYEPEPPKVIGTAANQGNLDATDGAAVYFAGSDGRLWNAYTNPGWNAAPIGGTVRALSPVVVKPDGLGVYFPGPDNRMYNAYYNASGWNVAVMGGSVAPNSGLAVRDDGAAVYYTGADGRLFNGYHNNAGWNFAPIGGSVRSGSPIASSADGLAVYFISSTGVLTNAYYNANGWNVAPIAGVTVDADSGLATNAAGTTAYYRGADGALYNAYHTASGWRVGKIGGAVRAKSPIVVSADGNAVDFIGSDNQLHNAYKKPGWLIGTIGGSVREGSGLSANSTGTAIYFTGTDGRLQNAYQKPGWKIGVIGGAVRQD